MLRSGHTNKFIAPKGQVAAKLDPMDVETPVIADPAPVSKSRLGIHASLFSYPPIRAVFSPGLILSIPKKKSGVLDDVRSNNWLDAMKSSSPTAMTYAHAFSSELQSSDFALAYNNDWGKKLALFLDYDGTLSPIVENTDCAFMSNDMRSAVRDVAMCFPMTIISGRSRDKVHEFVGLKELYYAGSHGMDIASPAKYGVSSGHLNGIKSTEKLGKEVSLFQPASECLPMIEEVLTSLIEATKGIEGATVENNKFCVSVHYRNVEEKDWDSVWQYVNSILKGYPPLRLTHGCKVLEVVLESLGLSERDDVLPIYVGDDRTDEDAFKVIRDGKRGYGILVSSVPKDSNPLYSLKDPLEVMEFLKALVRWHTKCITTTYL